jgi:hypothetical protein
MIPRLDCETGTKPRRTSFLPQLDPEFIIIRTKPVHDIKTNGNGATSYGRDKHAIAKIDRVSAAVEAYLESFEYVRPEFDIRLADIMQSDLYDLRDKCANAK